MIKGLDLSFCGPKGPDNNLEGIALDNKNTVTSHQIASVYYDGKRHSYRLDYGVTAPSFLVTDTTLAEKRVRPIGLPKKFLRHVSHRYENRSDSRNAEEQYEVLVENLLSNQDCLSGFDTETYKPALIFSFCFDINDGYTITDQFVTAGRGRIFSQHSYDDCNKRVQRGRISPELKLWQDFIQNQDISGARRTNEKHSFQSVVEKTTMLVQGLARETAHEEYVESIFRINMGALQKTGSHVRKIEHHATGYLQDQNIPFNAWQMPITNDRSDAALLNQGFLYHHLATGAPLLPRDIVNGLAVVHNMRCQKGIACTPVKLAS